MSSDCNIPRHVTGLYIFTVVNLIALLQFSVVNADVTVYDTIKNETGYFFDMDAQFGPQLSEDGITGYLLPVLPLNNKTCDTWYPAPMANVSHDAKWIALVQRNGRCKFDEMVFSSQKLGYSCVIVYNVDGDDSLVHMGGSEHASLVNIPSVFVGYSDGIHLFEYQFRKPGRYKITVNRRPEFKPYLLWPFAVVVGTCFVLMIVFMIFKWVRGIRRKKKSRLSTKLLKKIPTKKFKKGDAYDVCAICLDDYEEKDKLRILPCNHAYHCKCIDPWLTKSKKTCPVCKRKVIPGAKSESESSSDDDDDNGNESSTERTPLLLGSGNNNRRVMTTPRRSTFDPAEIPNTSGPQLPQANEAVVQNQTVIPTELTDSDTDSVSSSEVGASGGEHSSQTVVAVPHHSPEMERVVNQGYISSSDSCTEDEEEDEDGVEVVVRGTENEEQEKKTNHVV